MISAAGGAPWKYIPASISMKIMPRKSSDPWLPGIKQVDLMDTRYGGVQGAKYNWIPTTIPIDAQDAFAKTNVAFAYVAPLRILSLRLSNSARKI